MPVKLSYLRLEWWVLPNEHAHQDLQIHRMPCLNKITIMGFWNSTLFEERESEIRLLITYSLHRREEWESTGAKIRSKVLVYSPIRHISLETNLGLMCLPKTRKGLSRCLLQNFSLFGSNCSGRSTNGNLYDLKKTDKIFFEEGENLELMSASQTLFLKN